MARDDSPATRGLTGADAVLRTLIDAQVELCFTNPGTSEMHFIAALDRTSGMRCVLGLAETVVTGAADGYARIAGKPAIALLHTGPGLANGLANLHNARRAPVPIINIIGEHATYHRGFDTPLASDIEAFARPVSDWIGRAEPGQAATITGQAVAEARRGAGKIATLILPADVSWSDAAPIHPVAPEPEAKAGAVDVKQAIAALRSGEPAMLLLGGNLDAARLCKAGAIAAACGARLAVETFPTRLAAGAGRPVVEKLPYLPELLHAAMAPVRQLVIVGAHRPATFFAYPGIRSDAVPDDCEVHVLAGPDDPIDAALDALSAVFDGDSRCASNEAPRPLPPSGPLNAFSLAQAVAAQIPEGAILVDEAITGGMALFPILAGAPPHDWLFQTGGAIGWGLPAAVGAAIAAPHRKILCVEGDGSALYSIPALWTMAREKLDVTVLIVANRDYAILKSEYARVRAEGMGEAARSMMSLSNPALDFVQLANGFGVDAMRVESAEGLDAALASAFAEPGPHLIEAVMPSLDVAALIGGG